MIRFICAFLNICVYSTEIPAINIKNKEIIRIKRGQIEGIEFYPGYDSVSKMNDIAIIILKSEYKVPISAMKIFFDDKNFSKNNLTFFEWSSNKNLKTLNLNVSTSGECSDLLDGILLEEFREEDGWFCAKFNCKYLKNFNQIIILINFIFFRNT